MAELPSNEKSWLKRVEGMSFETKTIHSFKSSASGSKIALPQFLLLRVLWVKNPATKLSNSSEYGKWGISKKHIEAARNHLREVSDWERYKSTFSNNLAWHQKTGFLSLGTFSLVRLYQLNSRSINTPHDVFVPKLDFSPRKTRSQASAGRAQAQDGSPVTPTRSKKNAMLPNDSNPLQDAKINLDDLFGDLSIGEDEEKSPESDLHMSPFSPPSGDLAHDLKSISDEQIVNMALLLYLQALLINFCGIGADWTPERRALIVKKKDGQKVYEARVDGFLRYQGDKNNPIMAIVEVKPCIRDINPSLDSIRMQEGAQMAAWICQHPPSLSELASDRTFSRLLVSQDRENIYLTFAEFNSSYVHYIRETTPGPNASTPRGKKPPTGSNFLKMNEYGPFNIGKDNHMDSLGQILLAFTIRACEIKEEALPDAHRQR